MADYEFIATPPAELAKRAGVPTEVYVFAAFLAREAGSLGYPYRQAVAQVAINAARRRGITTTSLLLDYGHNKGFLGEQAGGRWAATLATPGVNDLRDAAEFLKTLTPNANGPIQFYSPIVQDGGMQNGRKLSRDAVGVVLDWRTGWRDVPGVAPYILAVFEPVQESVRRERVEAAKRMIEHGRSVTKANPRRSGEKWREWVRRIEPLLLRGSFAGQLWERKHFASWTALIDAAEPVLRQRAAAEPDTVEEFRRWADQLAGAVEFTAQSFVDFRRLTTHTPDQFRKLLPFIPSKWQIATPFDWALDKMLARVDLFKWAEGAAPTAQHFRARLKAREETATLDGLLGTARAVAALADSAEEFLAKEAIAWGHMVARADTLAYQPILGFSPRAATETADNTDPDIRPSAIGEGARTRGPGLGLLALAALGYFFLR